MNPNLTNQAGSAQYVEPAFVLIGIMQRTHGIRGEITLRLFSSRYASLRPGRKVYLGADKSPYTIETRRQKNELYLLKFEGLNTPEDARLLTNLEVFFAVKELPSLPAGQYYEHQLIGLEVWQGDEHLGRLENVLLTGANDVYLINTPAGKELLIPAIPQVIQKIDLANTRMEVILLEGLRD